MCLLSKKTVSTTGKKTLMDPIMPTLYLQNFSLKNDHIFVDKPLVEKSHGLCYFVIVTEPSIITYSVSKVRRPRD